jgi:alkyl sulfatase BDS1-like metallo-beta-lactamase superfamily hydrolase
MAMIAWDPDAPAVRIHEGLAIAMATSNAHILPGPDGDVIINTGTAMQGARIREKFETLLGRPLNVAKVILTQSHPDHTGGWSHFAGDSTETFAQAAFDQINAERKLLGPFFGPRNARVLAAMIPPGTKGEHWFNAPDPAPVTTFQDSHDFEYGGRRFHLFSLSSGETLDSLGVWLPDEKTVFIGNWAGAILGALPHFYTARGDRDRSVTTWLRHCDQLIALGAEMLVTGHGMPVTGADKVRAHLTHLRQAVAHIHDETVKGMNEGRTLADLRTSIALPPHLETEAGRGPVDWYVRAVWEEYAGWFKQDLTSELYGQSAREIWPELAEMAGGAAALAARANDLVAKGEPVKALHFIEIALDAAPDDAAVRQAAIAVFEALLDATGGRHFDLVGWLEGRIMSLTGTR